jgi:hypothetical protein
MFFFLFDFESIIKENFLKPKFFNIIFNDTLIIFENQKKNQL